MKILSQKNIWQEYGYDRFLASMEQAGVELQEVNVIPFTKHFDEEPKWIPDYIFGSGRFVNLCREKNYPTFPSFNPVEYDIFPWEKWINNEGYATTWGCLEITQPVFVKPFTEKFFTGLVIETQADKEKVQLATSFIGNEDDEMVLVAPTKPIAMEVRYFVLNGTLITGSISRKYGRVEHTAVDPSHDSYSAAQRILDSGIRLPKGFVLDVGSVNGEWKIVELNNLNSAGLYKCDTDAIVRALEIML